MNRLRLVPATREEPFFNLGPDPISEFLEFQIDDVALLRSVKEVTSAHHDVVTALTVEFPRGAVECLDALLGTDDIFSVRFGADEGEVPLYVCPIDYDPLCGGIVATVTRTDETVRISGFRYTSYDEQIVNEITSQLEALDFTFERAQFDRVLGDARARFVELAKTWVRPGHQLGVVRRSQRRLARKLGR